MTFSPIPQWASSYEETFNKLFEDAAQPGFSAEAATAEAWQEWNDSNVPQAQCIAPTAAAMPLTATKSKTAMAPIVFSNPGTPPQAAQVLSSAWAAWATAITWTPPPPAPPFSAIFAVLTDPASIAAARAVLYSGLLAEFAIIPPPGGEKAKYTAFGTMFSTAYSSLMVNFTGLAIGAPPPPLMIPVPVF